MAKVPAQSISPKVEGAYTGSMRSPRLSRQYQATFVTAELMFSPAHHPKAFTMASPITQAMAGQGSAALCRKLSAKQPWAGAARPQRRQSVSVRAAATGPGSPKRPGDLGQTVLDAADTFFTVRPPNDCLLSVVFIVNLI